MWKWFREAEECDKWEKQSNKRDIFLSPELSGLSGFHSKMLTPHEPVVWQGRLMLVLTDKDAFIPGQ